ncbi:Flavin-dependent halogenase gsfI [Trichinella spiralis]|uniref:Flavin-dependent halogenase gsfI n=1 Tax=Trichinella spiralis TaxID=6334 RepID=A0ABR3K5K2_TRISP
MEEHSEESSTEESPIFDNLRNETIRFPEYMSIESIGVVVSKVIDHVNQDLSKSKYKVVCIQISGLLISSVSSTLKSIIQQLKKKVNHGLTEISAAEDVQSLINTLIKYQDRNRIALLIPSRCHSAYCYASVTFRLVAENGCYGLFGKASFLAKDEVRKIFKKQFEINNTVGDLKLLLQLILSSLDDCCNNLSDALTSAWDLISEKHNYTLLQEMVILMGTAILEEINTNEDPVNFEMFAGTFSEQTLSNYSTRQELHMEGFPTVVGKKNHRHNGINN